MQNQLSFYLPLSSITNVRDIRPMFMNQMICFGHGLFDDWCAYTGVLSSDGRVYCAMPSDKYYFEIAKILASTHGVDHVYDDVKHIFEHTGKNVDQKLLDRIYQLSLGYGVNQGWAYNMFMHLYYGMIAEENKENTKLGRSIKMNGIYSLLKGGRNVNQAADECCGQSWKTIQTECLERQIYRYMD